MKLEKNDAWAVANEEIKTLQEIIQDANAKLQNQENELRREQDRGNELEQKIYEAQIKARFKNYPSTRQNCIVDIFLKYESYCTTFFRQSVDFV